ncbi:MAG: hypothetical protein KDC44_17640, partial [Phaeodactylibacter sp.]|nr:hypothetical protein [Phaeodactylibacter sp.]
ISIIGNTGTTFTIEALAPGTMNITLSAIIDNMLLYSQAGCTGPTFPESLDYLYPVTIVSGPNAVSTTVNACNNGAGMGTFDLTSVQNIINGGTGNTVNWFTDVNATIPILNPGSYTSGIGTIYATVSQGNCVSMPVPITLNLTAGPSATPATLTACDQGGGFSSFDLTTLNSTVTGGSGLMVNYWVNMAATIPAIPSNAYFSNTTTLYATVTDGICTSSVVAINLEVLVLPNPGNAFINVSPTSACGMATVIVTFNLPAGNNYDITLEYGNATNGYNTFTANNLSTGSTAPFSISETTEFILTTVAYSSDPSCFVTFSNPMVETVTINTGPDLVVSNNPTICVGEMVDLSTLVTDQNGSGIPITFHGATPPVPGNQLPSPIVAPITNTTYYAFADGGAGCQSTAQIDILVTTPATPVLGTTTICDNAFPISLIPLLDPAYPTGTWSGMGVSGNAFDPDGLSGPVTLTFTSDAPCTLPAMTTITVNTQEAPMLLDADICVTGGILDLTTLQDPNYPTGTWSGPGVIGTTFFPIGQSGPVGLNFNPDDPCALQGTAVVTVNEAPSVLNVSTDCDTDNLTYTVSFEIVGGDPGSYVVDGMPIAGNTYTSAPIPTGTAYSFSIDDGNGCGPNIVSGVFDCQCVTFAGTMDLAAGPIHLCNGEAFSIAAFFNNDEVLDGDDLLNFIIHDNAGGQLGATFGTSIDGSFNFPGAVTLGQSY